VTHFAPIWGLWVARSAPESLTMRAGPTFMLRTQGVELMFLLLKAKRSSRYGAIKALDFACTR